MLSLVTQSAWKKAALCAAFVYMSANSTSGLACASFKAVEVPQVRAVAVANGSYQLSDSQCDLLQRKGLVLHIVGYGSVLSGAAIGWAEVRLQDVATGAISEQAGLSTFVNSANGTQEIANELLLAAIKDAIVRLDFEAAAAQVDYYREKVLVRSSIPGGKQNVR